MPLEPQNILEYEPWRAQVWNTASDLNFRIDIDIFFRACSMFSGSYTDDYGEQRRGEQKSPIAIEEPFEFVSGILTGHGFNLVQVQRIS